MEGEVDGDGGGWDWIGGDGIEEGEQRWGKEGVGMKIPDKGGRGGREGGWRGVQECVPVGELTVCANKLERKRRVNGQDSQARPPPPPPSNSIH